MADSQPQNESRTIPLGRVLVLDALDARSDQAELVAKALNSSKRLGILRFLGSHTCSVKEIAEALDLPLSTASLHINTLEEAGLIKTDLRPSSRGLQKVCARFYDQVVFQLPIELNTNEKMVEVEMPIGAYVDAQVSPTCGLAGELGIIGHIDDPNAFYEPERIHTQLLWFGNGHIDYRFPNKLPPGSTLESLEISFETCSEAPLNHPDWPSDITLWINHIEIGSWTSPADFGGERAALTPAWWDERNSQFGLLKIWKVTPNASYIDGVRISNIKISDLKLKTEPIHVRIGIKEDAQNIGGINIFGKKFGNYPQDLILKQRYHHGNDTIA